MSITDNIVAACLIFKYYNFSLPYKKTFLNAKVPGHLLTKKNKLVRQNREKSVLEQINRLAACFNIFIYFIHDNDGVYQSNTCGPSLYIRINKHAFVFHSNAGKITKLPNGVAKMKECYHRLDDIINASNVRSKKVCLAFCTLNIHTIFYPIEQKYNVGIEIWEKIGTAKKASFKKFREPRSELNIIKLHHDKLTNKLFLIQNEKLYFRYFKING